MSKDSTPVRPRDITLRFLAEPTDVNFGGKVHGGAVMKWIDQAGYACAVGWSGYYCVTVYIGGIRFYKPIFIGQIVEVSATVVHTGTSSMHIAIDVSATEPKTGARKRTTRCLVVFVAVDGGGDRLQPGRVEELGQTELDSGECVLDPRQDAHGRKRVPANLEEVRAAADARGGHVDDDRPNAGERTLGRRYRSLVSAAGLLEFAFGGLEQRAAVQLAVGQLRHGFEADERVRHHVRGQSLL